MIRKRRTLNSQRNHRSPDSHVDTMSCLEIVKGKKAHKKTAILAKDAKRRHTHTKERLPLVFII